MILTYLWPWNKVKVTKPGMNCQTQSKGYSHTTWERSPLSSVCRKPNITVSVKSETCQLSPIEYVQNSKRHCLLSTWLTSQFYKILFSMAIAGAILMQTSAEQVLSLHRVALKYLKLVTSSNFWLFTLISALMLLVLLVMILFSSVLTSIPYAVALFMSLLVRSWSSPLLPPMRSMYSANRGLHMGLKPMLS